MSLDLTGRPFPRDDRITCESCAELAPDGACIAARDRRRRDVSKFYGPPKPYLPWRCVHFVPLATVNDQRTGRDRWPSEAAAYDAWLAEDRRQRRAAALRGVERAKKAVEQPA